MAQPSQNVANAELSVLQALWDMKSATVQELTERIYQDRSAALMATVKKLLERLETKKHIQRDRKTWPHQFSATIQRDDFIASQLKTMADKFCEGEIRPLLSCLVKTHGLTDEDRVSLRGLLDELDREKK
jgi:predicted transcriptional regulator